MLKVYAYDMQFVEFTSEYLSSASGIFAWHDT